MEQSADRGADDLRIEITRALGSQLGAAAAYLSIAVEGGSVTLTGVVRDYATHHAVLGVVEAVDGVQAVVDELGSTADRQQTVDDTWIARQAQRALRACDGVAIASVTAEVRRGVVTLVGTVSSTAERLAAERAVTYLPGLTQIHNRLHISDG